MIRSELIQKIADENPHLTQRHVERIVNTVFEEIIEALAKGDEVATVGGLLGKISRIGDTTLGLELATGVEVHLQRSAVVQVLPKGTIK